MEANVLFEKKYKIEDLYVARLCRVTKIEHFEGERLIDVGTKNHTTYDGPVGIFLLNDNTSVAKRISTGVKYYYFNGEDYPQQYEWYVKKVSPITRLYGFDEGVRALDIEDIRDIEIELNDMIRSVKYRNDI